MQKSVIFVKKKKIEKDMRKINNIVKLDNVF